VDLDPPGDRPVLFFTPPVIGTYGPLFPRGATTVATYLESQGIPAVVIPLSHCVDIYGGGEHVASMTRTAIREAIAAYRPRAIGVSVTFSYLYPQGLEIARLAREADADVPILMGGPHVTYQDRECLAEAPYVDIVVRGEGEWTALETLRTLEAEGELGNVLGITWRDRDGTVHRNKRRPLGNVLELPPLNFGLLPRTFAERMEITGLTSRGCKFKCTFCHEFRYWGTVVRDYSPQRVVDELERIATQYGNTMRGIDDSMLSMLEPSYFELCELLAKSPHKSDRFNFLTRIDTVTPEGLDAMKRAGIPSMSVGLESGSPKILKAMNKGFDLETAKQTLCTIRDAGVGLATFFIVGHPGDDAQESEKTLEFVDGLFRDDLTGWIDLSIFTPYPGTPFFINPKAYGIEILSLDWSKWRRSNRPIAQLTDYSASEIYLTYLRMLENQAGHHARKRADPHVGLRQ
jgi:magnesium-protoporphyrin IX monomethyl ester (oxidative) cyclase